ncbi:MAG: phosphoribosylglycinamide formyltransferase [Deltaproteobacteria bacterium]
MKRVAILISGSGSNMVALAEAMRAEFPARAVVVISNNPDAGGLEKAQALGIPTEVVNHRDYPKNRPAFDAALDLTLSRYTPDLICSAGFMRILTPEFITKWSGKMLNIHPSLLPKYPGLHTHDRALEAGDPEAGCSVHIVTPDLDAGPILGQSRVPVRPGDSSVTLAERVLKQEHRLYPLVLERFCRGDLRRIDLT